jgi:hypothetical protein
MNIYDALKEELNKTLTENGDLAFNSTGDPVYDFVASVGTLRGNNKLLINRFLLAFNANRVQSIQALFYARDIINGVGERDVFRTILSLMGNMMPGITKKIIPYIKDYGRFDDYLVLLNTPVSNDVAIYLKKILDKDLKSKKGVSLLAKWLPSINASSADSRMYAKILSRKWGYSFQEYRLILSKLRKQSNVIETYLCAKDYSFDYNLVPGQSFIKNFHTFDRHDKERFNKHILEVANNKAVIHTKTIQVQQLSNLITEDEEDDNYQVLASKIANIFYKDIEDKFDTIDANTIVVRDGSGSMYSLSNGNSISPITVADSLSILFASKIVGPLHDSFITFSEKAELVTFPEGLDFTQKSKYLSNYNDAANTNIENVYNLLLNLANNKNLTANDMIKRVIIISDMEFDMAVEDAKEGTLASIKNKFEQLGLEMPQIIYWNVENRHGTFPVIKDTAGVFTISGYSQNILKSIVEAKSIKYDDILKTILSRYSFVETLKI